MYRNLPGASSRKGSPGNLSNASMMKAGFVNIFGKPNAGKSTLLNALMGEKLAIVSHKVQTTRHRIKGIVTANDYQIIFSDTPGIIEPRYKLHEKMMQAVKSSLEDADLALLMVDAQDNMAENDQLFSSLNLKVPSMVVVNKLDLPGKGLEEGAVQYFQDKPYARVFLPSRGPISPFFLKRYFIISRKGNLFSKARTLPICQSNSL